MPRCDSITLLSLLGALGLFVGTACGSSPPSAKGNPDKKPTVREVPEPDGGEADAEVQVRCQAGSCGQGRVCDARSGVCRMPLGCADLSCSLHQQCKEGDGVDSVCAGCEEGFSWHRRNRRCEPIPSCDAAAPGSIAQSCAAQNRGCEEGPDGASCGTCVDGAEEREGECVIDSCAALETPCASPQACVDGADGASCEACIEGYRWDGKSARCLATCAGLTCGQHEWCQEGEGSTGASCRAKAACEHGMVAGPRGDCVPCAHCYDRTDKGLVPKPGVKGVGNGGSTEGNVCVCELKEGYFQALTAEVLPCDADGDGWMNRRATILEGTAMARHARCRIPRVDRFLLVSDDTTEAEDPKVSTTLTLKVDELLNRYPNIPSSAWAVVNGVKTMALIEDEALDEADKLTGRYEDTADEFALHEYGDGQARPVPAQANPLTKLCNHQQDDFNMDGVEDASQSQLGEAPENSPFFHLAYFAELATGRLVNVDKHGVGAYQIQERSRRSIDGESLPISLGLQSGGEIPYAAKCMRSRDASFPGAPKADEDAPVGYDFAQFQCAAERGGCQVESGTGAHVAYDGRKPRHVEALERLAESQAGGPRPWDAAPDEGYFAKRPLWPGMNHHSQFKCVSGSRPLPASQVSRFTFQKCGLTSDGQDAPRFDCETLKRPPDLGTQRTYWANADVTPYEDPSDYTRGCIDEAAEWSFACGRWRGRHAGEAFVTTSVPTGEFTCGGGCARGGNFVIVDQGGICCFGDPRTTCGADDFKPSTKAELLCALDPASVGAIPHVEQLCDAAFGPFRWAGDETSVYDPNSLQWAAEHGARNESVWQ